MTKQSFDAESVPELVKHKDTLEGFQKGDFEAMAALLTDHEEMSAESLMGARDAVHTSIENLIGEWCGAIAS